MKNKALNVEKRVVSTKHAVKSIRGRGYMPGVLYGKNMASIPVKVKEKEFRNLEGANLIEVFLEEKEYPVFIREIQRHPVKGHIIHVDFQRIDLNETIKAMLPLTYIGEPVGEKEGGVLQYGERALEVEALPADLPENLEVDLTPLDIGGKITAGDLVVDPKIKILSDPAALLAVLTLPRAIEEEPAAETEEEKAVLDEEAQEEE